MINYGESGQKRIDYPPFTCKPVIAFTELCTMFAIAKSHIFLYQLPVPFKKTIKRISKIIVVGYG